MSIIILVINKKTNNKQPQIISIGVNIPKKTLIILPIILENQILKSKSGLIKYF
jgi:hypothetical protein